MMTQAAGFSRPAGPNVRRRDSASALERLGRWERCAHWLAPLLTAGLLGACTYLMFLAARGGSVI
ncbi:MAG TPA: hypothetical protein VKT54_02140 [Steroidobacteraceae bacterium]|nr:hypothetical protein [Steroidobacteraceae bacterium]